MSRPTNAPLGSFPRYGHQQARALLRREKAIAHSVLARRIRAEDMRQTEIRFFHWLEELRAEACPKSADGREFLDRFDREFERIRHRLFNEKHRVYFARLRRVFRMWSGVTVEFANMDELTDDQLDLVIQQLGFESRRYRQANGPAPEPPEPESPTDFGMPSRWRQTTFLGWLVNGLQRVGRTTNDVHRS